MSASPSDPTINGHQSDSRDTISDDDAGGLFGSGSDEEGSR